MNNFSLDKKPHILSSPESSEGGAGGINGPANQAETELRGEVLEGHPDVEVGDKASLENALGELVADLGAAETSPEEEGAEIVGSTPEDTLDTLIREEVEASKPKFKVGENGLSLQGSEIQSIQSQIQQLESGQRDLVDSIRAEIAESRQEEIENLESEKFKLEGKKAKLTNLVLLKYNELLVKSPNTKKTLDEFTKDAMNIPVFSDQVSTNETALQEVESKIKAFNTETQTLIEIAIQDKKTELQQQLTEAQANYTETGAEAYDKPILLERAKEALEQRLSKTEFTREVGEKTEFYISDQDLEEIFALYGYVDGMKRIKKLKKDIEIYNGSEQTERNIQYFAGAAKEKELEGLRDKKNTLQKELEDIEGDTSYQETSHLERDKARYNIQLNLLGENLGKISCEVRLTNKGFELQEDYQILLEELLSKFNNSITSINTELDRLGSAISNIRALSNFRIPEGTKMRVDQLKDIDDYLEQNKSKSRWNPSRDQDSISRLSPILENIKLRIAERDEYINEYNSKNTESLNNTAALQELNEIYSQSEYIRVKLGQTELTDKNSIIQAINQLKEYIEQYQKLDDFDTKQERVRELRQEIDTISKQENDLRQYNPNVIYN